MNYYRYVECPGPEGVTITCKAFKVVGETDKCWYITEECNSSVDFDVLKRMKRVKRISKAGARRQHAYPTKALAMTSYKARKEFHLLHATRSLELAKTALDEARLLVESGDALDWPDKVCAGGQYFKDLNWDC